MKSFANKSGASRIGGPAPNTARLKKFGVKGNTGIAASRKASLLSQAKAKWGKGLAPESAREEQVAEPLNGKGRTFLVPDPENNVQPPPICMYAFTNDVMEATPELVAYAAKDPAAQKLIDAIQFVSDSVKGAWTKRHAGLKAIDHWLGPKADIPTYIRINSTLRQEATSSPAAKSLGASVGGKTQEHADVDAATTFYQGAVKGAANWNWATRVAPSDVKGNTTANFEQEFGKMKLPQFTNLMIYDREELMANSPKKVAKDVWHEFYYHISIPFQAMKEGMPMNKVLSSDVQHEEGNVQLLGHFDDFVRE